MTQDPKGNGVAPADSASGQEQEETKADKVSYDTYARTLSEAKRAKRELDDLRSKLTELEQSKLAETGKKDELLESYKKENVELKTKLNSAVHSFARSRVQEVFSAEAVRLGCVDHEIVSKAFSDDIKGIDFDDSFQPDREQVLALLTRVKNERPHLFSKPGPAIGNHQPKVGDLSEPEVKPIRKLSNEDLYKKFAEVFQSEKTSSTRKV